MTWVEYLLGPFTQMTTAAANVVTMLGLPLALWALFDVFRQMRRDRLTTSAASVGSIRQSIMNRIERLSAPPSGSPEVADASWEYEASELLNELEMACAMYLDGQMWGRTGELARRMLIDILKHIAANPDLKDKFERASHAPSTFQNIKEFKKEQGL